MEVNPRSLLSVVARHFGLKCSSIEKRLQLQKIIYLMQTKGLNLGYAFNWYKHGPYSQNLADDAYAVLQAEREKYKATEKWRFNKSTRKQIKAFEDILSPYINNYRILELVASIDYMNRVWGESSEEKDLVDKLLIRKERLIDGKPVTIPDIKTANTVWKQLQEMN